VTEPAFTFVFPSLLNGRLFEGFDYHLGTGYIRAYLAKRGVPTCQFIDAGEKSVTETVAHILATRPRMVGFSCYDNNYHLNRLLAYEVRRQAPDVPIVFGGPSATFSDQLILSDCYAIDICCRSYSEETAFDLVRWSLGELPLDTILGITFRQNNNIVRNCDRPIPTRLQSGASVEALRIPAQTFHDTGGSLDLYPDPYVEGFLPPERVSDIGLVTSRGCTFACTFCNFSAMSGRSFSAHSLDYVMNVFRFLERRFTKRDKRTLVTINDDNFSLQGKRFHELLRLMSTASFENLSFWAEMRTETLREDTFELLKEAGFSEINFGLESAVPHVLAAMKKVRSSGWERDGYAKERIFLDRIAWAVRRSQAVGIKTTVSVILGGPSEMKEDGQRTLDFIEEIGVDSYAHNFIGVGAGTELAKTYKEWGLVVESPSDRVLPFLTHVTYDVYQLKILDHDRAWLPMAGFEMRQANLLFTGTGNIGRRDLRPRGNGRGGRGRWIAEEEFTDNEPIESAPVFAVTEAAFDQETARWLACTIPIATNLWLMHSNMDAKRRGQRLLNELSVPVQELNTLRRIENETGITVYCVNELSPEAPPFNTRTLRTIELSHLESDNIAEIRNDKHSVLHLAVEKEEDLALLLDLTPAQSVAGEWLLGPDFVAARSTLQDACRWCSSECPATRGTRWLVSDDKSVRPCLNGGKVGHVGETLAQIIQFTVEMQEIERKHRGCVSCPVRETCAKCLFPHPLSVEEYCRIQKSHPALPALIDGFTLARSLLDNDLLVIGDEPYKLTSLREIRHGGLKVRDTLIPLSSCVLLEDVVEQTAFIYSQKFEFLANLPPTETAALKALLQGSGAEGNSVDSSAIHTLTLQVGLSVSPK
jgi:radical SAM superfamily enzyme YgiQ (UPF0313 family)